MSKRERPSRHGAILGEALSKIAAAGRAYSPTELPDACLTCAFREGCMTNQMAATGMVALNCVIGIDPDRFACHHGMKDGEPSKLCVGYVAAILAPFSFTKEVLCELADKLNTQCGPDEVRAEFDAWLSETDPDGKMDDYQLARAYAATPPIHSHHGEER